MRELAPALWRWTAAHPDWKPEDGGPDGWERDVGCIAWDADDRLVLIDPLLGEGDEPELWPELDALAAAHHDPVAICLAVWWHERSAGLLLERYAQSVGADVWALPPSTPAPPRPYDRAIEPGEPLPGGLVAYFADRLDEVVLWLPEQRAIAILAALLTAINPLAKKWRQSCRRTRSMPVRARTCRHR